ncbi:MAG: SDR family NAD(P)-dependent oxidoreductase [Acetobacteraceae bacterium]
MAVMMPRFRSVLITGASSGIGNALARACATEGANLHLSGRDPARLEATAAACRSRGVEVSTALIDVRDAEAMAAWITGAGHLDLVVGNAGISATGDEMPESTRDILATNLCGVLNTVLPAMQAMASQEPGPDGLRGRIAAIASIAAFIPSPEAPAYCASKAAVDAWMVGSVPAARASGIALTSVCPGFIRTPMTAGHQFPMPGLMDAERAALITLRGIEAGRTRVVFPWWIGFAARIGALLPPHWTAGIGARWRRKARFE